MKANTIFDCVRVKLNFLFESVALGNKVKSCSGNDRPHELNSSFACPTWRIPIFQSYQDNFSPEVSILDFIYEM